MQAFPFRSNAGVAQGLEQAAHNRLVVGSNPTARTRREYDYIKIAPVCINGGLVVW